MIRACVLAISLFVCAADASAQATGVVTSPHNLSVTGPGQSRAVIEDQVCIFCHAPHNAAPVRPLWNRTMPLSSYAIYTSRELDATPGQPTGTSKMCLSCHDGTIALGAVVSRDMPIGMSGVSQNLAGGPALIGTDLRDDHPISFKFDASLASRDSRLQLPSSLPEEIRLDANEEMQCTACHDPHNNFYGDFLVMDNVNSELCISCHAIGYTPIVAHKDCIACHENHSSPSGPYLLRASTVTETCITCHDGSVAGAANISSDLSKFTIHDTSSPVDPPDPQQEHTSCTSCHDPHTMATGSISPPNIQPTLGMKSGVNISGAPIEQATYEYEVCFSCHAENDPVRPIINRQVVQSNLREEFSPNAVSYHPVASPGRNSSVPSLLPPWTTSSMMHCSECHASDTATGGLEVGGPHGSNNIGLLARRYETSDYTSESALAYALCYQCHDRNSILDATSPSFPEHRMHVLDQRTPCSACHDPHGVPSTRGSLVNNSHLINFDMRIVQPDSLGRMEYRDLGRFSGECFLTCHGVEHAPLGYSAFP